MSLSKLVALSALTLASAARLPGASAVSQSWSLGSAASQDETIVLNVMLRHSRGDVARLEEVLLAVSDPKSDLYGKHLTLEQVGKITPVPVAHKETVRKFFTNAIDYKLTPNEDIATVTLTVSEAERLFATSIHTYTHSSGAKILRASDYTVPSAMQEAVYIVGDLVELPSIPTKPVVEATAGPGTWDNSCPSLKGCAGFVTPSVLTTRYKIDASSGMNVDGNSMAVSEFQGQYFKPTDIQKFGDSCGVNVTVDKLIGGNRNKAGVESELDIEYIGGVSPGIPLTVIYTNQFSLLNWMTTINGDPDTAFVHSVSYGNDENQQSGDDYEFACNVQFMKAGARGLSVLFASGDQGVCGREGCGNGNNIRFKPDFPAASPYITAVGGTDFVTNDIGDEAAWALSGGGFSDTYDIPDWQAEAVSAYKNRADADLPPQSVWNNTGRGYPDVSALGGQKTPYCVVANGVTEGVAGTSASCPVVASVFARLNGLRLAAGKPTMGWLNPWIYQNGDAFNDVQAGCNTGGVQKLCFKATGGWDPATGFGTPNFEVMSTRV